jgi:hypothetical protein
MIRYGRHGWQIRGSIPQFNFTRPSAFWPIPGAIFCNCFGFELAAASGRQRGKTT